MASHPIPDDILIDHLAVLASDPMYVTPLAQLPGAHKLPWQCNYCNIGPVVGRCCPPGRTLIPEKGYKGGPQKWSIA